MKLKILSLIIISVLIIPTAIPSFSGNLNIEIQDEKLCYGYIIPVNKNQTNEMQIEICKLLNELLRKDIEIFWITNQINISTQALDENNSIDSKNPEKGSYIIPVDENQSKNAISTTIIYKYYFEKNIPIFKLMQSLEDLKVYQLVEPKIAIHNGPKVESYSYPLCVRKFGFEGYDFFTWDEIPEELNNQEYNMFIWGGGWGIYSELEELRKPLRYKKVINKISNFVKNGGGYIGSCYGCQRGSSIGSDYYIKLNYYIYNPFSKFLTKPGIIIQKVVNSNNPVVYGVNEYLPIWHHNGPPVDSCGPNSVPIAEYYDIPDDFPWKSNPPKILKNLWMKRTMGRTSIVSSELGDGRVVTFGSHPEIYFYVDKYTEYTCPPRLIYNSIFYVTSNGPANVNITKNVEFSNITINIKEITNKTVGEANEFKNNISNGTAPYSYYWDFGDNTSSTDSSPIHQYLEPGNFTVFLTVIDKNQKIDIEKIKFSINGTSLINNNPPDKPLEQFGDRIIKPGKTFFLFIKATDPEDDQFWFRLKIKKSEEEWKEMPLYSYLDANDSKDFIWESNQNYERDTVIEEKGTYYIKVQAIDLHGAESQWSEPTKIIVTNHPIITKIFDK